MAQDPRLERLRDAATNPALWKCSRYLRLTPLPSPWREADATAAAFALFERVASDSALLPLDAQGASRWSLGTYGRPSPDRAWVGEDGGILVAASSFGSSPSDGIDSLYHCVWHARGLAVFEEALDYTQQDIGLELSAVSVSELQCLDEAARAVFLARGVVEVRVAGGKPWTRNRVRR